MGTVLHTSFYYILQAILFVRSPLPVSDAVEFNFSLFLYLIYKLAIQDVSATVSHSYVFFLHKVQPFLHLLKVLLAALSL
jgi:hypothetical protein